MNYLSNFFRFLNPGHVPSHVMSKGIVAIQKETLLQYILTSLLIVSIISFPFVLPTFLQSHALKPIAPIYYALPVVLGALVALRMLPYNLRAGIITLAFFIMGLATTIRSGLSGSGLMMLLLSGILAIELFPLSIGLIVFAASLLSGAATGWLMINARIPRPTFNELLVTFTIGAWQEIGSIFLTIGFVIILSNWLNYRGLNRIQADNRRLNRQIEEDQNLLEKRSAEAEAEMRRRLTQFEVAGQIARDISSETNFLPLLQNAVNMVRDRFGFYHAGIFLNDDRNEYSVLRAATGDAGRKMIDNNHRLKIGEVGIVGYVTSKGEALISENVIGDEVHFSNPLLPDTRSEIALPLIASGRTIGALDVQSVKENAFSQEDVRILQMVADQLAVAVVKTGLLEQLKRNIDELESHQLESTRQVWQTHLRNARRKFAYQYRDERLEVGAFDTPQAAEAVETGQAVVRIVETTRTVQGKPVTTLAVPIKIRNLVLGVVDIEFESAVVSPDLIALIENTVNRLAVSLENARLLEEIQYRAERERLVSEITTKVRASSEVENILRIAAEELGKSLGVSEVMVQLRQSGQ